MYLATHYRNGSLTYHIRQSYLDSATEIYTHRLVFDLGSNPADHFELLDGEIPYFHSELQDAMAHYGCGDADSELEELLWPFFPYDAREKLSRFKRPPFKKRTPLSDREKEEIDATIHIFDRRRLYYLYYGAVDQSRLYRMHDKLCRPLLGCSRDEREYQFMKLESQLKPREYHTYIYAIFNLQKYFDTSFAAWMPETHLYEEIGEHFEEALCELNESSSFTMGEDVSFSLYHHLRRYLVMFFDYIPARQHSPINDFVRNFMNSHRQFRWPERKPEMSEERIHDYFSTSYAELKKMGKKELTKLFRTKAKELHPDKGGDHDTFVELMNFYQVLMKGKK